MFKDKLQYLFLLLVLLASPALAEIMTSTSYIMERDSINFSGGLSTSTSYGLESTLGESGTGNATSTSYDANMGYQQYDGSAISMTINATAALSPDINLATGGSASTSAEFTIITNNSSGYTLQIKANDAPAMQGSSFDFSDYGPVGADPDYTWTVAASDAEFGFTADSVDLVARFKDNGLTCNQPAGVDNVDICWDGLSTSYANVAQSAASNYPIGTATTVRFQVEAGSASSAQVGSYSATVIALAYTN
jgi:hypothetical protein